ncbi:MAG: ligand-binding sensor domain-containing protein [Anaerolineae bacterium]
MGSFRRFVGWVLTLCVLAGLAGCASPAPTPTLPGPVEQELPQAIAPSTYYASSTPDNAYAFAGIRKPTPTAIAGESVLSFSSAAIQSWTDPNDVTGLVYAAPNLWAATRGGVVRWNTQSGQHRLYTIQDGLASQAVQGVACDRDGHIWVGYSDHATWTEFDGQAWHSYASREEAVAARYEALRAATQCDAHLWAVRAGSNMLWLPTYGGGVEAYDGTTWYPFGETDGVTPGIHLVAASSTQSVWAVGEAACVADEQALLWKDHSLLSDISLGGETTDLATDAQGNVWLSYRDLEHNGGVGWFDPDANHWVVFDHALNQAIPAQVNALRITADGSVWVAGSDGLALRPQNAPWRATSLPDLDVQAFLDDGTGRVWLGTSRGVWSMASDGSDLQGPWTVTSPLVGSRVAHLAQTADRVLWLATPRAISSVDVRGHAGLLTQEEALCLATDQRGTLWYGTRTGLYHLTATGETVQILEEAVSAIAFGVNNAVVVCLESGRLVTWKDGGWQTLADLTERGMTPVHDLRIDSEGTVWLATAHGLVARSPDGGVLLATEGGENPLLDLRTLALGIDGALWVGGPEGLAYHLPSGEWTRLTPESTGNGLRSTDVRHLLQEADGTLWIATRAGVSMRLPDGAWRVVDVPGALCVYPMQDVVWVGTEGGVYRVRREALVAP